MGVVEGRTEKLAGNYTGVVLGKGVEDLRRGVKVMRKEKAAWGVIRRLDEIEGLLGDLVEVVLENGAKK